jgi:hypothetical protein
LCQAFDAGSSLPKPVQVTISTATNYIGDMPMMTRDTSELGGNRVVTIVETTKGTAPLSGSFTLSFNGYETTPLPMNASKTVVQEALIALDSIPTGGVTVNRGTVDANGGYEWTVTFTDGPVLGGDVQSIIANGANLKGNDHAIHVCTDGSTAGACAGTTSVQGNQLGGTFTLELLGHVTSPIDFNASDTDMKRILETLPNIGTVTVSRTRTSLEQTFEWRVTFASNPGAFPTGSGDVAILVPNFALMTGAGKNIAAAQVTQGSTPLSGTFTVSYDPSAGCTATPASCAGLTTAALRSDTSSGEMKSALEGLANIGTVDVTRVTNPTGYTWRVTFSG